MEISLSCDSATVYVLDAQGYEVVAFHNVKVKGDTGLCANGGSTSSFYQLDESAFEGMDPRDFDRNR